MRRLNKCDGTAPLPSSENEQGLPRSLAASKCSTALFYSFAATAFPASKSSRLSNAGQETASVDLRAPRDVIDGRLRRVKPNPAMETEGESRACGLMRRVTVNLLEVERMRAQSCSLDSPKGEQRQGETKSTRARKGNPVNLDTCRCANSSCPIRETCRRWTERHVPEWGRLVQNKFEPGPDGVCRWRIPTD